MRICDGMMREHKSVSQAQQLKELEASFALATKEMQSAQAKMAVETTKEVFPPLLFSSICFGNLQVNNDPKLKTKAEKDRRLKEKQAANTKKIIDERKSKGMKENKVKQKISIFIRNAILLFFVQHKVQHSSLHTMGKCNPLVRLFINEGRSWISSWKLTEHC